MIFVKAAGRKDKLLFEVVTRARSQKLTSFQFCTRGPAEIMRMKEAFHDSISASGNSFDRWSFHWW